MATFKVLQQGSKCPMLLHGASAVEQAILMRQARPRRLRGCDGADAKPDQFVPRLGRFQFLGLGGTVSGLTGFRGGLLAGQGILAQVRFLRVL